MTRARWRCAARAAAVCALAVALDGAPAQAQPVSVDEGVRVGGLWCFPLVTDPNTYVYLPSQAQLATDESGSPQFSFVRYVMSDAATGSGETAITAARGGGILHFLVTIETPAAAVSTAQADLRRIEGKEKAVLRGPLVFSDGRYALVSSILGGGKTERHLLATGRAPVLEGNRLAFSFQLEPEQTSLLLQSLSMATPDVSIVFDMTFHGLSQAYDADLFIDWSEVRKSEGFSAGGTVYFVSADVEAMFEDLRRNNAIRLVTRGSDASMEALLTTVYNKLLELLFRPVPPERIPADQRGGMMDALNALTNPRGGPMSSRSTTGFGVYGGFQLKDLRSSGSSVLSFNHRSTVERHTFITFNIGDVYKKHGKDERYVRTRNLADPAFQQREIRVSVDGALAPEFDRSINAVTVTLRKQHESGNVTLRELILDKAALKPPADFRMVYGWDGDQDRLAWLKYDMRTRWSFKGGGSFETPWAPSEGGMIDLFAPFERRTVQVVGSVQSLAEQKVRSVVVSLEYGFFGEKRRHQVVIRPDKPPEADPEVDITLPLGVFDYDYTITWQLAGGERRMTRGRDSTGVIFIDEVPAAPNAALRSAPAAGRAALAGADACGHDGTHQRRL